MSDGGAEHGAVNGAHGAGLNGAGSRTLLWVERGNPSPEELAALTVLFAALAPAVADLTESEPLAQRRAAATRGRWNDPARRVRRTWAVGPGGWRAAG